MYAIHVMYGTVQKGNDNFEFCITIETTLTGLIHGVGFYYCTKNVSRYLHIYVYAHPFSTSLPIDV